MKKIFYYLSLFSLSLTGAYAQVSSTSIPRDSTILKQDSLKAKTESLPVTPKKRVISKDEIDLKGNKKADKDSILSYSEEYRRGAVSVSWGIRGGLALGRMNLQAITPVRISQDATGGGLPLRDNNNKLIKDNFSPVSDFGTGYSAAIFLRLTRGSFFFQPEIVYATKSGSFDIIKADFTINRISTKLTHIDIPLLFGIRFRQARVYAGPVLNFPFKIDSNLEDALKTYINPKTDFKSEILSRPIANLQGGISFDLKHLLLDFRYEAGLSNPINYGIGSASNPSTFAFSTNAMYVSVGYIF